MQPINDFTLEQLRHFGSLVGPVRYETDATMDWALHTEYIGDYQGIDLIYV